MKAWEPALWVVVGLALAVGLLGQCRNTRAYQELGFTFSHTAITHSGPLDAYLATALQTWGSYSEITDGGAGGDLMVVFDPGLPSSTAAEAHPLDAGRQYPISLDDHAVSCWIAISPSSWAAAGEIDRQRLVTHEVGHCLGIAHSDVAGALMEPRQATGAPEGPFGCDDAAAIAALYPRSDLPICQSPPLPTAPMPTAVLPPAVRVEHLYVDIARD